MKACIKLTDENKNIQKTAIILLIASIVLGENNLNSISVLSSIAQITLVSASDVNI